MKTVNIPTQAKTVTSLLKKAQRRDSFSVHQKDRNSF